MKKIMAFVLSFIIALGMTGCGGGTSEAWQEQYDLGIKFLSEMNYDEAIVAFNKAIEIDPKQAPAYVSLAQLYSDQGDAMGAESTLLRGWQRTGGNSEIEQAFKNMGFEVPADTIYEKLDDGRYSVVRKNENGKKLREVVYRADGTVESYTDYKYYSNGICHAVYFSSDLQYYWTGVTAYDENDNMLGSTGSYGSPEFFEYVSVGDGEGIILRNSYENGCSDYEYDNYGHEIRSASYDADGTLWGYTLYEYNENDNMFRQTRYSSENTVESVNIYEYDSDGRWTGETHYDADGNITSYRRFELDGEGRWLKDINYDAMGEVIRYTEYTYYEKGGRKTEMDYSSDYDGNIYLSSTVAYDENGNEVHYIEYNSDGSIAVERNSALEFDVPQ